MSADQTPPSAQDQQATTPAMSGTAAPDPHPEVSQADLDALAAQLGRVPRGVVSIAARAELGSPHEIEGVSAGGMPTRVKCLHALLGHALAAGPGINPIGDLTLEALRERGLWDDRRCSC